jgi:hypothetical protein
MRRALLLACVAVAVAASSAQARPSSDTLIRPGKGIGRIELGMTEARVRRLLGRPEFVLTRQLGFGRRYVELQYQGAFFIVGLLERGGGPRTVVSVGTSFRSERTPEGAGPGTLERRLLAVYGSRLRCERLQTFGGSVLFKFKRECVLRSVTGVETVFVTTLSWADWSHAGRVDEWRAKALVVDVVVRRGGLPS